MDALTVADVQAALDQFGLGITITQYQETTATSQQAADRIGCELGQIAKSICFMVKLPDGEKPVLVITSGDQRVDDRKIAALVGVSRKNVRTAKPEECVAVFGYAPGSVPPLAHRTILYARFIDDSFKRFQQIYAAGGAHNAIFPITLEQLVQVTGGVVSDVRREETTP
jgi:prolyl-tRNA editing enzyme YbaK/EbsC (Cys-tRNA(Pro) deacylase)